MVSKSARVLVVDDDEAVRDGLSVVLSSQPDIEIVGETGNREDAIALIANLKPSVVLLDIRIPNDDGVDVAKYITAEFPGVHVIIYSALGGREREVTSLGFRFMFKGCESAELLAAIREEASR